MCVCMCVCVCVYERVEGGGGILGFEIKWEASWTISLPMVREKTGENKKYLPGKVS